MDIPSMRRHYFNDVIVVLLCLQSIMLADGFPGASFSATLPSGKNFTPSEQIVKFWQPSVDIVGMKVVDNVGFQTTVLGIYIIGYVINIHMNQPAAIKVCIQLNDNPGCPTLVSQFNSSTDQVKQKSFHATGVLKLHVRDIVSLKVISNQKWHSATGSVFFGQLTQTLPGPAFYANPRSIFEISNGNDQFIQSWDASTVSGSFSSSILFSPNLGQFSVSQSGFYFISANIILEKESGEEKYYLTLTGNEKEVSQLETSISSQIITMGLYTIMKLKTGMTLFLKVRKDGDTLTKILPESSFSVAMIKDGLSNANGFKINSFHESSYKMDDALLKLDAFKNEVFSTIQPTRLIARSKGSYILCYNLKMKCLFANRCSTTLKIERKLQQKIVLISQQTVDKTLHMEKPILISNSFVVNLSENEEILLKTENNSNMWYLLSGTISFLEINEIYPTLSQSLNAKRISNSWSKITNFQIRNRGVDFSFTADLDKGDYVIQRTGIYHVSTNIIVNQLSSAMVSASITINNNPLRTDGLTMLHSETKGKCTLNIASSIYLKQGCRVSVYIKVDSDIEWEVDRNSTFSLVFLGSANLVIGFQTTLSSDVMQRSAGWNTPSDWLRPSDSTRMPWSFQNNARLSPFGTFKIPITGVYLASANIIVGNADLISRDSVFIGMLSVNWVTSSDLVYARKTRKLQTSQNDARNDIGLSISSVLSLRKGDTLAVKVCSKTDSSWTIKKATGFSVVLLSSSGLGQSAGLLALRKHDNKSLNNNEMVLSTWSSSGKDPLLFQMGKSLNIISGSYIKPDQTGLFFITITFHITIGSSRDVTLGLFFNETRTRRVCAVNTQIYASSFINCYLTLFLKPGDSFTPYIEMSDTRPEVSIEKACYVSAFHIERPRSYPWFYAELKQNFNGTVKLKTNSWSTRGVGRFFGHSGFTIGTKYESFSPDRAGIYLITSIIILDETTKGIQNVNIETISANSTSISTAIRFYTTNRSGAMTLSLAVLLPISEFGFRQNLQAATASIINKKSSLSAAFLPKLSSTDTTQLTIQQNQVFRKPGFSYLNQWVSLLEEKPRNFITVADSVYFISAVLLVKLPSSKISLYIGVNEVDTQLKWIVTETTASYSTFILTGFLKTIQTGELSFGVQLEKDQLLKINRLSKVYVTRLGSVVDSVGVISSLELGESLPLGQSEKFWSVNAKSSTFANDIIVKDGIFVVKQTGIYIISMTLLLASSEISTYEVFVRMDGSNSNSMYAKQKIISNGTISVTNSVHLQRGMVLDIVISTKASFDVLSGSNIGIILLEDLDSNVNGILPPVIYKDILPYRKRSLPLGSPITLTCYCVADEQILYKWFQNGNVIESSLEKTIELTGQSWESGEYHCEAVASSVKAISRSVRLEFLGLLDCNGQQKCNKDNETCSNALESSNCECVPGSTVIDRKCSSNNAGPVAKPLPGYNTGLPVAVVILAPIGLFVFLFLIGLAIYTYYKHKKMLHRRHLHQHSSFTERFTHHAPDEDVEVNPAHEFSDQRTLEIRAFNLEQGNVELEIKESQIHDEEDDVDDYDDDDDVDEEDRDLDLDFEDQSFLSVSTV